MTPLLGEPSPLAMHLHPSDSNSDESRQCVSCKQTMVDALPVLLNHCLSASKASGERPPTFQLRNLNCGEEDAAHHVASCVAWLCLGQHLRAKAVGSCSEL